MSTIAYGFCGFLLGAALTLAAVNFLYGGKHLISSPDGWGRKGPIYVVGTKRFDWFRPHDAPNCWGGHTLDGRCISLIVVNGENEWKSGGPSDEKHP